MESGARESPGWGRVPGGGEGPCLHRCPRPAPQACVRWGEGRKTLFGGAVVWIKTT